MIKPTQQAYNELQEAYDFFNDRLFDTQLPSCLITLQREKKSYGYFSRERWENREGVITDEIALNPAFFAGRTIEEVLSTEVHEMTHLWQKHFGKPGRGRYHNKEWGDKMESLGLMPSATRQPGGARIGDKVSHYIIDGGPFALVAAELIAGGFTISWLDRAEAEQSKTKGKNRSNRIKYTCPDCGMNAWAKPGISLLCGECELALKAE